MKERDRLTLRLLKPYVKYLEGQEKQMEVVYVSGPISSPTYEGMVYNAEMGIKKGANLASLGYAPIIPHANFRGIANYGEFAYKTYMRMDFAHLKKSDVVYMMDGWENSKGAKLEERYARLLRKKVIYERKLET